MVLGFCRTRRNRPEAGSNNPEKKKKERIYWDRRPEVVLDNKQEIERAGRRRACRGGNQIAGKGRQGGLEVGERERKRETVQVEK